MTRFKLHLSTDHKSMKPGPVNVNPVSMYGPSVSEVSNCLPLAYRKPLIAATRMGWRAVTVRGKPDGKPVFYAYLLSASGRYLNTVYAVEVNP
jgi:hypothetical protein